MLWLALPALELYEQNRTWKTAKKGFQRSEFLLDKGGARYDHKRDNDSWSFV